MLLVDQIDPIEQNDNSLVGRQGRDRCLALCVGRVWLRIERRGDGHVLPVDVPVAAQIIAHIHIGAQGIDPSPIASHRHQIIGDKVQHHVLTTAGHQQRTILRQLTEFAQRMFLLLGVGVKHLDIVELTFRTALEFEIFKVQQQPMLILGGESRPTILGVVIELGILWRRDVGGVHHVHFLVALVGRLGRHRQREALRLVAEVRMEDDHCLVGADHELFTVQVTATVSFGLLDYPVGFIIDGMNACRKTIKSYEL